MNSKFFCLLLLAVLMHLVEANEYENKEVAVVEARGKAKYALLIHFFYVVATKLFVLKIVYGAIFYALIVKGWHFVSWFIHYLKEKKPHSHYSYDHVPHHHGHHYGHEHYGHDHHHHDHYGYGHHDHDHYSHDSYEPYAYDKHGSEAEDYLKTSSSKKTVYDADGSYSVKT